MTAVVRVVIVNRGHDVHEVVGALIDDADPYVPPGPGERVVICTPAEFAALERAVHLTRN